MSASTEKPNRPVSTAADPENEHQVREYLFVSHSLEVGGIETLLVRMANAVADTGSPISVLAAKGPLARHLRDDVRVILWDGSERMLAAFRPKRRTRHLNIWCSLPSALFDAWPLQKALWAERSVSSSCVTGIFHPAQWYHSGRQSAAYARGLALQILSEPGAIYFMNDASRAAHVDRWGRHLLRNPIFRLHMDEEHTRRWKPTESQELRIVSIGRIVPFKNYNYDAASILARLAAQGVAARWTIFGDGEDRTRLIAEAQELGLGDCLTFSGEIAYDEMQDELLKHDLFVGMGTAVLEAAAIGMPSVLALSDVPNGSYGFLDESPSDSVAEVVKGREPIDLGSKVAEYARLHAPARLALGERCRQSAISRSGDEHAPFDAMFAGGCQCPTSPLKRLRRELLLQLRRAAAAAKAWA